jgi:hypothetical protein
MLHCGQREGFPGMSWVVLFGGLCRRLAVADGSGMDDTKEIGDFFIV